VITAQDVGSQAHQARALLTINVLDENDNAPVFESFPNLSVMENRRYPMLAVLRVKSLKISTCRNCTCDQSRKNSRSRLDASINQNNWNKFNDFSMSQMKTLLFDV